MPKLSRLPARKIIQKLRRAGFFEVRQSGSHVHLENMDNGRNVIIPVHGSHEIPIGTLHGIVVTQAGLSVEEFNDL